MRAQQQQPERLAGPGALGQDVAHGAGNCRATSTSSRRPPAACRCASSSCATPACREGADGSAPPRSRGAGRSGRGRRHGCRRSRPDACQDMAEHSMCQPGRPRPQGLSQPGSLGVGGLPQHEVAGIALVGRDIDARAGQQLVRAAARELAVVGEAADARTARGPPRHRRGRWRSAARSARSSRAMWPVARGSTSGGRAPRAAMSAWKSAVVRAVMARDRLAALPGARVDLVVHVGDVPDVGDARVEPPQQPRQHVEHHDRPRIAQMRQVVDRRAADIEPHMGGVDAARSARLRARQAVVQEEVGWVMAVRRGESGAWRRRAGKDLPRKGGSATERGRAGPGRGHGLLCAPNAGAGSSAG